MNKCCICGNEFDEHGNNPAPIKTKGICCNKCNERIVIPTRAFVIGRGYALWVREKGCELIRPKGITFTLKELQSAVGGFIEYAPTIMENNYIIVNEEGLVKNFYKNTYGKKLTGVEYRGDILICPKELVE